MILLYERIKAWALGIAGIVIAILGALLIGYRKGSKAGANDVEVKASQAVNEAVQDKNKIESKVDSMEEVQIKKELEDKWSRE